jgi:hypothetical protein
MKASDPPIRDRAFGVALHTTVAYLALKGPLQRDHSKSSTYQLRLSVQSEMTRHFSERRCLDCRSSCRHDR